MKKCTITLLVVILSFCTLCQSVLAEESLLLMAGAASAPVIEELAKAFEVKTGVRVHVNIGGSGMLLSQIKLTGKGDVYFPGSIDFIEQAKKENQIDASTITPIVYLVPAINVQRGNPQNIKNLKDLCRPGLKVAIANPESVCLGVFATELFEKNLSSAEIQALRQNLVTYTESCEKTATAISLKAVDAIIGWGVFEHWNPELIETVKLKPEEIVRISYLAVAVTKYAGNPATARNFIEFMKSDEGLAFFKKFKYFTTSAEALEYLGADKPVGGEPFKVPPTWMH
ncbi:MAG TPA: substrate-binding domain-containing protein [Candidatus Rifleibacterium sp.]|nr:substrate-binding domain-containing protein [Candidatus Rifleibacterium sp.]HPT44679.1 substrate-binding domain-containing protein [Candidatus Rifleibacterium sp.]